MRVQSRLVRAVPRLVRVAIAGKLAFSAAQLGGFAQQAQRKPVEELDDIFEFDIGPPKA